MPVWAAMGRQVGATQIQNRNPERAEHEQWLHERARARPREANGPRGTGLSTRLSICQLRSLHYNSTYALLCRLSIREHG